MPAGQLPAERVTRLAPTDTAIRNAKPSGKLIKLADGGGLVLRAHPHGSRWWRFRYRLGGEGKMLSVGVYPDDGLKDVRNKRDGTHELLAQDIDPADHRKAAKAATSGADSFEYVAREWHARHMANKSQD